MVLCRVLQKKGFLKKKKKKVQKVQITLKVRSINHPKTLEEPYSPNKYTKPVVFFSMLVAHSKHVLVKTAAYGTAKFQLLQKFPCVS